MRKHGYQRELEATLSRLLHSELGVKPVDPCQPLIKQGVDSLMYMRYIAAILRTVGVGVTTEAALAAASIEGLAALVASRGSEVREPCDQGTVTGVVRRLPNRVSYVLRRERDLERWVVGGGFFSCQGPLGDPGIWQDAAAHILQYHDGLRLQAQHTESGLDEVIVAPDGLTPVRVVRWSGCGDLSDFLSTLVRDAQDALRFPGELVRFLLVQLPSSDTSLVYVLAHHLLVDGVTFRRVVRDLFRTVADFAAGREVSLAPKATPLTTYAASLLDYWSTRRMEIDAALGTLPWRRLESSWLDPYDPSDEHNRECDSAEVDRVLGSWSELAQHGAGEHFRSWVPILLAAIGRAYHACTDRSVMCLGLVCHGRESFLDTIDVSRTAGYLVDIVPILVDAALRDRDLIDSMEEQVRWAWLKGRGYSVSRFSSPRAEETVDGLRHPRISLNILPQSLGSWRLPAGFVRKQQHAVPPPGVSIASRVLLVSGGIYRSGDKLVLAWDYSRKLYERSAMDGFVEGCRRAFLRLREVRSEGAFTREYC